MPTLFLIRELTDLANSLCQFEQQIKSLADRVGLNFTQLQCDHISVRCNQRETAERWRTGFLQCARLFSETMIAGRPILLFELTTPIKVLDFTIDCVELPYPGHKQYYQEGWEHLELVVPCSPDSLHQMALSYFSDKGLLAQGIDFKMSNPQGEGERLPNPTLAVSDRVVAIKFHPYSIKSIVESQQD